MVQIIIEKDVNFAVKFIEEFVSLTHDGCTFTIKNI